MKLCVDCKWHSTGGGNYCHNPKNGTNPVVGGAAVKNCATNRIFGSFFELTMPSLAGCGKQGRWWEPKEGAK